MCKWNLIYSCRICGKLEETPNKRQANDWSKAYTVRTDYAPECNTEKRGKIIDPDHKFCQFCGSKIELNGKA